MVMAAKQNDNFHSAEGRYLDQEKVRKALDDASSYGASYAEVRLVALTESTVAMRDGALNYLEKPIYLQELQDMVCMTLGITYGQVTDESEDYLPSLPDGIIAASPSFRDVIRETALVAPHDSRVLITGESGTGKEVIANLLHQWSQRTKQSMVSINCATIPDNLLESELFGHEKGAFTGATVQRRVSSPG